jgi:predicted esterase
MRVTRREFSFLAGATVASVAFSSACDAARGEPEDDEGRLKARPQSGVKTTASGEHPIGLGPGRDAILHLPPKPAEGPMPLFILLHGASGAGDRVLRRLGSTADQAGVAVLAPDSRGITWDAIRGGFGPDVTFLNRALEKVFATVAVDPARLAIGGFSDGATYALSMGLINGDLFARVVAFSPGFVVDGTPHGKPRCFVSHGKSDDILPIDSCSRKIVPLLTKRGHDVTYREFDGGHDMPAAVVSEAMAWLAAR